MPSNSFQISNAPACCFKIQHHFAPCATFPLRAVKTAIHLSRAWLSRASEICIFIQRQTTFMNTNKSKAQAERIVLAMLEHCTEEKAAAALGMSTSTIRRWLKRPEFQELYRKARVDAFSHVTGRAQYMAPLAAATLTSIANDPTASPTA